TIAEGNPVKVVLDDRFRLRIRMRCSTWRSRRGLGLRRKTWVRLLDRLRLRLNFGRRRRGLLRKIFLEQGLRQRNHQKGQREHQQEPTLHAGILLGILKVWQIRLLSDRTIPGRTRIYPRLQSLLALQDRIRSSPAGDSEAHASGSSNRRVALRSVLPLP